jgi:hypothetical protein
MMNETCIFCGFKRNIGSRLNFPSFQPCSRGYPTADFGICAFNHIFVWYEDLRTCCLNVSSLAIGGSITKVESLTVANFTRHLFRSIWHRFDFPFGSYSLDISMKKTQVNFGFKQDLLRELRIVDVISLYTSYASH